MNYSELELYKSTRSKVNRFLEFEIFEDDLDKVETFMKAGDHLIHLSENHIDIFLDFDIDEAEVLTNGESTKVFEKIPSNDIFQIYDKIKLYKEHLIRNTLTLFDEVYIHEDDIKRNIKKIEYLVELQNILKKEK